MEIRLKNMFKVRDVINELHLQLLEAAYWIVHYWGQVTYDTELDRRLGRRFDEDVERELGSPRLNQEPQREPTEEELEELIRFLEEEANETYDP